uniref:Uncharacterized protein n=1 Tax=Tanacetum cinerariifolium TaxID=118510 RepID=A0A699I8S9_TANCI|nr:hypothetical protein [Tanacetum cinerariifolium]
MRDFHKTHPSGSGTVTKTAPSVANIKASITSEGIGVKPGVLDVAEEEPSKSEAKSWGNDKDDSNNEQDSRSEDSDQLNDSDDDKTQSDNENESDFEHETDESKSGLEPDHEGNEKDEDDEEEVKDEFVKTLSNDSDEKDETMITDKAKGDEDEEIDYTTSQLYDDVDIRLNEAVDSDKVPVSIIYDSSPVFSTVIPKTLPSFTPPPQQSASTPPPTTEATNPPSTLLDFASVFQINNKVTTLEKEVAELKKDPLHTQVTALVDDHLDARLGSTRDEFMNYLLASITARIIEQIKPYDLDTTIFSTYGKVYSLKRSRKDKDKDEDHSTGSDRGLKKRKNSKDVAPTTEEPEFEVEDSDMPQDQEVNPGNDDEEPKEKVASNHDWFTKPTQPQEPIDPDWNTFDELMNTPIDFYEFIMNKINNLTQETLLGPAFRLLKGTRFNYAELEYDFKECYKALLEKLDWENPEGSDYPFDLTKPLPLVTNRNRQMGLKTWFQTFGVMLKSPMINMHYEESHIGENNVKIMRKHGYGYLKEIKVRRADNDLYTFKEGDFSRLLESYQKKINITMPETTRPDIRKKDPYTPYQDPQGLIYVDTLGRNRLMRSDELYKFSDGTLTRFQTFLEDITNNIHMEYLPKRRWSTLLKKRANIMIKAIDKKLK